ncbi:MAG: hypothetical protein ACLPUO_24135 [Streptosporangiaceae bacterium]
MCEIPGIGPGTARSIIGETGLDVTGVSDTARQLCSWAKLTTAHRPVRRHQTLREDRQRQTGLGQAATGAAKTGTFLGERYRRLVKRMPKAKDKPRSPAPSWSSSSSYWPTPPSATKTWAPTTTPSGPTPGAAPPSSPEKCAPSAGRSPW